MLKRATNWLIEGGDPMPWRRVAITTAAVTGPSLVTVPLFGVSGAMAFVAGLAGHLAAKDRGIKPAALVGLVLLMSGLLALESPDMALILSPVLAVMIGICGTYGLAQPAMRALIVWTIFTGHLIPGGQDPMLTVMFMIGLVWALGLTWAFGEDATGDPEDPQSREYALIFGVMMAVGLTISVYIGGRYFGDHGFWFPLTFVVLCVPPHGSLFSRTARRTIGTILGTAIAMGIAWGIESTWIKAAIGIIALPIGFRFLPRNYTVFTTLLTITVLELLALVADVSNLAVERLLTMFAAAVMTIALGLIGILILKLFKPDALKALQDKDDHSQARGSPAIPHG